MIEELKTASFFPEWKEKEFIDPSNPICSQVETVFQSYRAKAIEKGSSATKPTNKDGMGNRKPQRSKWLSLDLQQGQCVPSTYIGIRGSRVQSAPQNIDKFLTEVYGDIYRLPRDMGTHCPHVSQEQIAALSQSADERN